MKRGGVSSYHPAIAGKLAHHAFFCTCQKYVRDECIEYRSDAACHVPRFVMCGLLYSAIPISNVHDNLRSLLMKLKECSSL